MKLLFAPLAITLTVGAMVHADEIDLVGGAATLSFDLSTFLGQTPLDSFDAVFGITETRDELLGLPGNDPGPSVQWSFNPLGTPSPTGRAIQGTTLAVDPSDVLGSWGAAAVDVGPFVAGGEQIGFGGMTRWTLDPGIAGVLLFGDWGLRHSPARAGTLAGSTDNVRSGLVLTSNIDFLNAAFVDIGNATISVSGSQLSISGDLLVSDGLIALGFPSSNLGLDIGDFTLTAALGSCPGDFTGDGQVDGADLGVLLGAWGASGDPGFPGDFDGNGVVDGADLGGLLGAWGACAG